MPIRKTRNVSLTPELEAFIDETVASGRYGSASEVVRAALCLLEREEQDRRQSAATGRSARPHEGRVNRHGG
jgi:antitoxin ParD1/3/4